MSKPTVTSVKAELDTHEAVCAERWKETILRIKRIETIMIGTAGFAGAVIHAFLLFVFLDGKLVSNDLYFRSVDDCTYFARALSKQSGRSNQITAYCLPKIIDPDKVKVY